MDLFGKIMVIFPGALSEITGLHKKTLISLTNFLFGFMACDIPTMILGRCPKFFSGRVLAAFLVEAAIFFFWASFCRGVTNQKD